LLWSYLHAVMIFFYFFCIFSPLLATIHSTKGYKCAVKLLQCREWWLLHKGLPIFIPSI
jgi:hypothetical protein